MSRTKKDILDTEAMLRRLETLLAQDCQLTVDSGQIIADARALRRISLTLHRWHELECGNSNGRGSWAIVRGHQGSRTLNAAGHGERAFTHDDDGKPFMEWHHYLHGKGQDWTHHQPLNDLEAGAKRRLAKILKRYPSLTAYVQTDPRGCALYILKPGDVREGQDVSSCYSNGLAVYR